MCRSLEIWSAFEIGGEGVNPMPDDDVQVFFVGAGPGEPGLLTLRAAECLAVADVIVHDRLVTGRILDYAPAKAERICVADLPGTHPEKGEQIHAILIDAARKGKKVVRLKGGDPLLFARGGEEVEAVQQAGLSYEIVPGVTSGLAAAAFAGIPLSHRRYSSAVTLVTGHEDPSKPDNNLDWEALARFPGTLVIYMAMARLPQIVEALLKHGKSPATPAAIVHWGSVGNQRTIEAPLSDLPSAAKAAHLRAPSIVIVGDVVRMRAELTWFEKRPLFGKQIVVTRPRSQAADLARQLEKLGAVPHIMPMIEVGPPRDWSPVDRALTQLTSYHWLVFTSANGVHSLLRRLRETGRDLRSLGATKLAAIGPSTAEALHSYYLDADVVPASFRSESLVDALKHRVAGQRVLLARADKGREILHVELSKVATVDQVAVYSQVEVVQPDDPTFELLREGHIHFVTLTSSNIARAFARRLDEKCLERIASGTTKLISISPVTSQTTREAGLPIAGEATRYTSEGIIEVLLKMPWVKPD
jgi:uroporphyrinogen III methyltransferase/synthase